MSRLSVSASPRLFVPFSLLHWQCPIWCSSWVFVSVSQDQKLVHCKIFLIINWANQSSSACNLSFWYLYAHIRLIKNYIMRLRNGFLISCCVIMTVWITYGIPSECLASYLVCEGFGKQRLLQEGPRPCLQSPKRVYHLQIVGYIKWKDGTSKYHFLVASLRLSSSHQPLCAHCRPETYWNGHPSCCGIDWWSQWARRKQDICDI